MYDSMASMNPGVGAASRTRRPSTPSPGTPLKRIPCRTPARARLCSGVTLLTCRLPTRPSLWSRASYLLGRKGFVIQRFVLKYFERVLVLLLVASLLVINSLIEQKFAFLSFYYLPIILAGFYGGRRFAVVSGLFIGLLVFFLQATQGMGMEPGLSQDAMLTLFPWAGFLILTGYVVGGLAEQRAARLADLKNAYMATLEVLTFHIESAESNQEGHSTRVAELSGAIGVELELTENEIENLRIAALLHEVG